MLDVNFKNKNSKNIDIIKAIITQTEINERNEIISEGKKILEKTDISYLLSKFIFEASEIFDKNKVKEITNDIVNVIQTNPYLAAGIINRKLNDISIKISPSAINSGKIIPQITFESIGEIFDKNERIVNGDTVYNYLFDPETKETYVVACIVDDDLLVFGFFKEVKGKLINSRIEKNMDSSIIVATIINEVLKYKPNRVEFFRNAYNNLNEEFLSIFQKNGYYPSKWNNSEWMKFSLGLDGYDEIKEMEDWDFRIEDQDEKSEEGDLSPMSITMIKRPKTGMNENIKVKKKKQVKEEGLSPSDQKNVTAAIGVLSSDLANNPASKNTPATTAMDKLTAQEKDALRKSAPQSIDNSQNLGDLVTNVGTELSSKGDTIAKDLTNTNKSKEIIKPFGTEQNTTPNTNDINE